jgi:hypothetical protein
VAFERALSEGQELKANNVRLSDSLKESFATNDVLRRQVRQVCASFFSFFF